MKRVPFVTGIYLIMAALILAGCCRSSDDVWEDTKTAGRHIGRGFKSLGGKHGDSRQVCSREDFLQCEDSYCIEDFQAMQFEPLPDYQYTTEVAMAENKTRSKNAPQAQSEPGQLQGGIPGIESFSDPKKNPAIAGSFQNILFPYNSSLIKGNENMEIVRKVAAYMKSHPDTYLFVEGHCDERGAEAYNLALGARRSNSVRNLLIKEGVSPGKIFTVSYGKERPVEAGHSEAAWAKNRRSEFKVYNSRIN